MVARTLVVLLLLGIAASPAGACGILERADPKVGSQTHGPLTRIRLTFSEAIVPSASNITLADDAGAAVKAKDFSLSSGDAVITLPLTAPLPPGHYNVHWQALWKDCGSQTEGHYGFTVVP